MRDTLRPAEISASAVRSHLRVPADVQGPSAALAEPYVLPAPEGFSFPPQMAEAGGGGAGGGGGPSQDAAAAAAAAAAAGSSAGGSAGASADASGGAGSNSGRVSGRVAQHCFVCGHKMRVGPYARHHQQFRKNPGPSCTLRADLRRPVHNASATKAIRKFKGECTCKGDEEHPGGCGSVL